MTPPCQWHRERSLERGGGHHAKPRDPPPPTRPTVPPVLRLSLSYSRHVGFHSGRPDGPTSVGEAQMHTGGACQSASSSADGHTSKHKHGDHDERLSAAHAFRPALIWTASITHYQTGAGSHFCHLNDPIRPPAPPTETRVECGGGTKERCEEGGTQNSDMGEMKLTGCTDISSDGFKNVNIYV